MTWFKNWFGTRYYALLYGHRNEGDARVWVDAILGEWHLPKGSSILDLACGRGRHARWLSEAGMDVTGVDISEASILEARNLVPSAEFHVHDMRVPFAQERFDAACCLFTSLGYFDRPEDDRAVFQAVANALKPNGRFVIDFMNTHRVLTELVPEENVQAGGLEFHVSRALVDGVIVKQVSVVDDNVRHCFEERVRAITPEQLVAMAHEAGFRLDGHTDGPELSPFDPARSSRSVLWLRKSGK